MAPDEEEGPFFGSDGEADRGRSFVPDFVRKIAIAGLGALFMTEEGIRNLAGQLKLPKEVLGFILAQAEKTKDEIGRVVSEEVRRFLQSEMLREETRKLLSGLTVEIRAEVRLVPEDEKKRGAEATTRVKVTEVVTKRARRGHKE